MTVNLDSNTKYVCVSASKEEKAFTFLNTCFSDQKSFDVRPFLEHEKENIDVLLAMQDDKIQGALFYAKDFSKIYLIGTDPSVRKQSVATNLLLKFQKMCKSNQVFRVEVECFPEVKDLFANVGFVEVSTRLIDDDFQLVKMEYLLYEDMLSTSVRIIIDHPYGSWHPSIPDLLMPCNMGYVDELMLEQGEIVNAYVLNEFEPLETFQGYVVGILYENQTSYCRFIVSKSFEITKQQAIMTIAPMEQNKETRIVWFEDFKRSMKS